MAKSKETKNRAAIARIPMSENLFHDLGTQLGVPVFEKEEDYSHVLTFGNNVFGMLLQTFDDIEIAEEAFYDFYEQVKYKYFTRNTRWFVGHGYKAFTCQSNDMIIHYISIVRNTILFGWSAPDTFMKLTKGIKELGYA